MKRVENTPKRAPFFPNQRAKNVNENNYSPVGEEGATSSKEKSQIDSNVSIPLGTKIFSRIKKLVDRTPPQNNMEKIETLRESIRDGSYEIDENKLSEKIAQSEFEIWRDR